MIRTTKLEIICYMYIDFYEVKVDSTFGLYQLINAQPLAQNIKSIYRNTTITIHVTVRLVTGMHCMWLYDYHKILGNWPALFQYIYIFKSTYCPCEICIVWFQDTYIRRYCITKTIVKPETSLCMCNKVIERT